MQSRAIFLMVLVALFVSMAFVPAPAFAATPCESLAAALLPGTTAITTQSVPAGSFTPPGSGTLTNLPAFCRVAATLAPTSASAIGVEVWMPATTWNGNFRGEGSVGSAGAFSFGAMATALRLGYATMSTDNGHKGSLWTFAAQPEKVKSAETDLPQAKLDLLTQKVLEACGDPVNAPLGFLVEPRRCAFDPARLQCPAGDAPNCLTPAQVES